MKPDPNLRRDSNANVKDGMRPPVSHSAKLGSMLGNTRPVKIPSGDKKCWR